MTFRHFFAGIDPSQARTAVLAAECGAEQGRFEALHHVLFNNATKLGEVPWEEMAAEAGVPDLEAFEDCLTARRYTERIAKDRSAVASLGISSIPGFVINGTVVTGAKPFDVLDGLVQEALNEAG